MDSKIIGARALAVVAVALTTGALVAAESAASTPSAAPGGPGAQSYLDLAREDCFATAHSTTSKVWFTVADGVLSDTFSPTIENSNVNTLQHVVGDPNAAETYNLNNGSLNNVDQRRVVDAGFLELTRLGELQASDSDVTASLKVVDSILERQTPSGPGWHRYGVQANGSTDGYGDCYEADPTNCTPSGAPSYNGVGSGHLWPILDGECAEQELQTGDRASAGKLAATMDRMSQGIGLMPEQVWEDPDMPAAPYGSNPATASIGFIDGKAAGSATPLIWAEGQYVRLMRDLQTGTLTDQPAITKDRYLASGPPTDVPVTISSPTSDATVSSSTTVTGTTAPGAQVVISTAQTGSAPDSTALVETSARNGQFSATVPTPPGTDVITVAVSAGAPSSGYVQEPVTAR